VETVQRRAADCWTGFSPPQQPLVSPGCLNRADGREKERGSSLHRVEKPEAVPLRVMKALGLLTSALDCVSGQRHAPAVLSLCLCLCLSLPPRKDRLVPIVQEVGWAPEPVWTQRLEEKSFAPARDRTSISRSSSPYTDTILAELPRLPHRVEPSSKTRETAEEEREKTSH
jgi:hypothetical protein